jgi:hypothetical protein
VRFGILISFVAFGAVAQTALSPGAALSPGTAETTVASTGGSTCTNVGVDYMVGTGSTYNLGNSSALGWIATPFYVAQNTNICSVTVEANQAGSPTWTATLYVYSSTTNRLPNTAYGSTATIAASTAPASQGDWTIPITTTVTAGTNWLVFNAGAIDSANYIIFGRTNSAYYPGGAAASMQRGSDGANWTILTSYSMPFRIKVQ